MIGSDDAVEGYTMLYFDERGVSRLYQMTLSGNIWKYWRNSPDFSQRFTGTITDEGSMIRWGGEMSKDGSTWEGDLEMTYTRVK